MPGRPGFQGAAGPGTPQGAAETERNMNPDCWLEERPAHARAPAERGLECIAVCSVQLQRTEERVGAAPGLGAGLLPLSFRDCDPQRSLGPDSCPSKSGPLCPP